MVHPLDQLQEGLIRAYIRGLITSIYRVKVDPRVYQMIDHLHLLLKCRSQRYISGLIIRINHRKDRSQGSFRDLTRLAHYIEHVPIF